MKMGFIGMMLSAGLHGLLSEQKYASNGAVVTAYVTSVRTPIERTLSDLGLSPGNTPRADSRVVHRQLSQRSGDDQCAAGLSRISEGAGFLG